MAKTKKTKPSPYQAKLAEYKRLGFNTDSIVKQTKGSPYNRGEYAMTLTPKLGKKLDKRAAMVSKLGWEAEKADRSKGQKPKKRGLGKK